jgi:catechol-2,3-dioxygenase
MADGIRLSAAIMFVRHLSRSVAFYRELLDLEEVDTSATAALLSGGGTQLVLRATGENAAQSLGSIGIQYLAWAVPTRADLEHRTDILRRHDAYRETRSDSGVTVVEGRDPDDLTVLLLQADDARAMMRVLPARIYAW